MPSLPLTGAAAPDFHAPALDGNAQYHFGMAAGRYVVLLFAGSGARDPSVEALRVVARHRQLFDDDNASFFGVTSDPEDVAQRRVAQQIPGIRWFLDYDRKIALRYGVADQAGTYRPCWLLLDPMLRVVATATVRDGERILRQLVDLLTPLAEDGFAPVLIVPRIFDPALCRRLIALYNADGGKPTGFMRDVDGVTVGILDQSFKRRSDVHLDSHAELCAEIRTVLVRNLVPQIHRCFQFKATRIERYIVACYDGDEGGGFFRPHRDNSSAGTSHRRFACSINLNADDYEGGDLRFPEFGRRLYRPPTGGAVVFSCSLLHEATPVKRGKRYAYLPFFYDEAAAKQREEMARSNRVSPDLSNYRA